MNNPIDYINREDSWYEDELYDTETVKKYIKQAQIDAYNEALDDATESAGVEHIDLTADEIFDYTDVLADDNVEVRVDKQSILKLKKQL